MRRVLPLLALAACAPKSAARSPEASQSTTLAAVLAAAVCPEVDTRLFALASGEDGITDTYVVVKRCAAHAEGEEVAVVADAYAWVAVDRELGPVSVREFVHATVHGDVRVRARSRFADDRLELTLETKKAAIAVEPVGVLDLAPLNWASLVALELAPKAGASPEALAKKKLRTEAERTLTASLAKPIVVSYDPKRATASLGNAPASAPRFRVVPHGTALVGPFAGAASAHLHVEGSGRVAVRAVCRSHAERILDADRRGDPVATNEWTIAAGEARLSLGALPCPWMLAMRATAETAAVVGVEVAPAGALEKAAAPDRWVSIDALSFDPPLQDGVAIVAENDVWRRTVSPSGGSAVVVLAPDEHLSLRAELRGAGTAITIGEGALPLDGAGETTVTLTSSDGRPVTTAHVRTRVTEHRP